MGEKRKPDRSTTPGGLEQQMMSQPRPSPSPKRQLQSPSFTSQSRPPTADSWLSGVIMKSLGEDLPQPVVVPGNGQPGGSALTSPSQQKNCKRHHHHSVHHHHSQHTSPQSVRPASNPPVDRLSASPSAAVSATAGQPLVPGIQTKDLIMQARSYAQNQSPLPNTQSKQPKMSESQISPSMQRSLAMEGMSSMSQQAIMNMLNPANSPIPPPQSRYLYFSK